MPVGSVLNRVHLFSGPCGMCVLVHEIVATSRGESRYIRQVTPENLTLMAAGLSSSSCRTFHNSQALSLVVNRERSRAVEPACKKVL